MGFSVGDLVRSIGGGIVDAIPGGSALNGWIDMPSFGGGNNLVAQPSRPPAYNNEYIPDVIEGLWNPAVNQPPQPARQGGCPDIPVVVQPGQTTRLTAPPGYVIVKCRGQKVAMLKEVARSMGYWKPRRKPPISAKDWRCVQRAAATQKKLKRVVSTANRSLGKKI